MPNQSYVSEEFHHFVGRQQGGDLEAQYDILRMILGSCRLLRSHRHQPNCIVVERDLDGSFVEESFISAGILCFCDIPANDLSIHTRKYGFFGLSFPRTFLVERGARPVIYMPHHIHDSMSIHGRQLLADIENKYRSFVRLVLDEFEGENETRSRLFTASPESQRDAIIEISHCLEKDFFSYIKAFDINLPEDDPQNYYMEREWRVTTNIEFELSDLSGVFVAPGFESRLQSDFPDFDGTVTVLKESS